MKFSCQVIDHKEKNGVRKSEMDERRKQAQDKVVGEVLEKAKEDGNRALKESYAAERREKSSSDTNRKETEEH